MHGIQDTGAASSLPILSPLPQSLADSSPAAVQFPVSTQGEDNERPL
jgi:hypothetical protein